jgi:hypothetical protein
MKKIDLIPTESEQTQRVELDGYETELRVYWSEIPVHIASTLGTDGQLFMDIKNDLLDIKHIALTLGNELMLPYGYKDFGGFIVVADSNPIIDGSVEWSLNYVPVAELDEIRKLYGSIV